MTATRIGGARRALLTSLVDHAALFPPASMSMAEALAEDARVRASDEAWMVGRFVVPASRLRELAGRPVELAVVVDVRDATLLPLTDARVRAFELPPGVEPDLAFAGKEVYVELPLDGDFGRRVGELAELGLRVKVRCGGKVVPSAEDLAALIRRCRECGVPFKATAGLHHAIAAPGRHGFLNLLAAAVFGDEESALADDEPTAFAVTPEAFAWRGRVARATEVARVRGELFVGFGSCSIAEPADELRSLGVLGG